MWNKELVGLLITKYQEHENLYNFRIPEYLDKEMRSYSMLSICKELQNLNKHVNVFDIKKKIHTLRTQFLKETREIAKSKMSGVAAKDVYVPKLWCFPQLQFLQAHCVVRKPELNVSQTDESVNNFVVDSDSLVGMKNKAKAKTSRSKRSDCMEINQNSCRICLEKGALVDWNEEILDSCKTTYKYCYYKYTQLEENVPDEFSQMLCKTCSCSLKSFHFLIEKALESYNILQQTFSIPVTQTSESAEKFDIKNEEIYESVEFEILNFEKSTELFEDDNDDNKESLPMSMAEEALEICIDLQPEQVKETTKKETSNKYSKILKKYRDYKKAKDRKMKLSNEKPMTAREKQKLQYRKITCAYCSKLVTAQHMKKHEQTHKENRKRSCICATCGLKLISKSTLYNHMRIHNTKREKGFKCEFCPKSYFNRGALNVHRRVHLGQLVSCPICQKEFYRQIDLDKHRVRTHDANIPDKNFDTIKYYIECKECGKNIVSNRFKHHIALHSNKFQMRCTLCDKHFASKITCHRHVRKVHNYTDEFANVVEYYGEEMNLRLSHLLLEQTQIVKPKSEMEMEQ